MAKIHDWQRIYWRNASGSREFFERTDVDDLDDEQQARYDEMVEENDRALYQNEHGDVVGYRQTPDDRYVEPEVSEDADDEDTEPEYSDDWHGRKYEVFFRDADTGGEELLGPVEFTEDPQGWVDEEAGRDPEVELSAFDTRGDARKFTAAWRAEFGSPEDLGYFQFEEDELPEEYQELQDLARQVGVRANQSEDDLRAQLTREEEPEFANGHRRVAAE